MPPIQSRPNVFREELKTKTTYVICTSTFLSVLQHIIQLQAEPLLIKKLVNGNPVVSAQVMANTSGIIGILGIFVNQIGGRLSDVLGRKLFFLVGPITSVLCGVLVSNFSKSLYMVAVCRILRILMTGFSSSVMCAASLSDILEGKRLSIANSYLGASVGAAVIVAPILEGIILSMTNMNLKGPAIALSALGALHAGFILYAMPETNMKVSQARPVSIANVLRNLDFSTMNPLSFMSLFYGDEDIQKAQNTKYRQLNSAVNAVEKNRRIIKRLVLVSTFQSFLEGKNVTDIVQVWQSQHLKWDAFRMRDFTVVYGLLCFLAGQFLTPLLLQRWTGRLFTTFTNCSNAIGFILRGSREDPTIFWFAIAPMLPGVNGASASAVKSMATDRCIAAGIGRGELSAWLNNLRAIVLATAPTLYGNFYAWAISRNIYPGYAFFLAAFFGAILPEMIHQTLTHQETKTLTQMEREKIIEGRKLIALQSMKRLVGSPKIVS
eukprot:g13545.t1